MPAEVHHVDAEEPERGADHHEPAVEGHGVEGERAHDMIEPGRQPPRIHLLQDVDADAHLDHAAREEPQALRAGTRGLLQMACRTTSTNGMR